MRERRQHDWEQIDQSGAYCTRCPAKTDWDYGSECKNMTTISPTVAELIEAAQDRPIRMSLPLPSSVSLADTEVIRDFVEQDIHKSLEEWIDSSLEG